MNTDRWDAGGDPIHRERRNKSVGETKVHEGAILDTRDSILSGILGHDPLNLGRLQLHVNLGLKLFEAIKNLNRSGQYDSPEMTVLRDELDSFEANHPEAMQLLNVIDNGRLSYAAIFGNSRIPADSPLKLADPLPAEPLDHQYA